MAKEIFVISDTHFGHQNIIEYSERPFNDVVEMDWYMVDRWNSIVRPQDKVYHLGDVYMGCKREYINNLLSKLNGKKRLILGNHDNGKDQILQKHFKKIEVWRHFGDFGLLLTHVPVHESALMRGSKGDEKKKLLNVHGHIHTNPSPPGPYKCVCVEQIKYTPVSIEELRKW